MEPRCSEHSNKIQELSIDIAEMKTADKFRSEMLAEIKEDVKSIKVYLEQQKGATRVVALVAGAIGSMATFFIHFIFSGFKNN